MVKKVAPKRDWKSVLDQTAHLTRAASISQLLDESEIEELLQALRTVWSEFAAAGKPNQGLKVFIEQSLDQSAMNEVIKNPLEDGDADLEAWCNRIFDGKRFGMIINKIESYSNRVSEIMGKVTLPLLKEAGLPLEGLSWLSFMGNYGVTPFGIHKEVEGEEGILFHLGPAPKKFYIWDTNEYLKLSGGSHTFPLTDELLASSSSFELQPGDAFFIPHHTYHVANTDEFSISVVLDYTNPKESHFLDKILRQILDEQGRDEGGKVMEAFPLGANEDKVRSLSHSLQSNDVFEKVVKKYLHVLESNAGIRTPSKRIAAQNFGREDMMRLKEPFQIVYTPSEMFVRGHVLQPLQHHHMQTIVSNWNNGKAYSLEELAEILSPELSEMEVMQFLFLMISTDAFDLHGSA